MEGVHAPIPTTPLISEKNEENNKFYSSLIPSISERKYQNFSSFTPDIKRVIENRSICMVEIGAATFAIPLTLPLYVYFFSLVYL